MDQDLEKAAKEWLAHQQNKARKARNNRIALGFFAVVGLLAYAMHSPENSGSASSSATQAPTTAAAAPGCNQDWHRCKDNAELMNGSNSVQIEGEVACQWAANKKSKYGDGSWGWIKFGTFHTGDDYIKTGIMTAIDKNVTFPNGYGAQVRSTVTCRYDMNAGKVESVDISEM